MHEDCACPWGESMLARECDRALVIVSMHTMGPEERSGISAQHKTRGYFLLS
jgi:hypothetical protein